MWSFNQTPVLMDNMEELFNMFQSPMSYNQYDASHFSQHGKWQPQHLVVHVPVNNSNGQLSAVSISGYNLPVNNRFQVLENNNGFPSLTTDSDEARLSVYLMLAEGIIDSSENEKTRFPRVGLSPCLGRKRVRSSGMSTQSKNKNKRLIQQLQVIVIFL